MDVFDQFNDVDMEVATRCLKWRIKEWTRPDFGRKVGGIRRQQEIVDEFERRLGGKVDPILPTRARITKAKHSIRELQSQTFFLAETFDIDILGLFHHWDIGPGFREVDYSQEPEEFRLPFNPDDYPEVLAFNIADLCICHALSALEAALRETESA